MASATKRGSDPSLTGTSCPAFPRAPAVELEDAFARAHLAAAAAHLTDVDSPVNEIKGNWREI
ncbi:MAG: hypothetical protein ACYDHX_10525 [Methanothrix sp.]